MGKRTASCTASRSCSGLARRHVRRAAGATTPAAASRSPAGSTRAATTAGSSSSTSATTPARCSSSSIPSVRPTSAGTAHEIRNEFVLQATGEVVTRAPALINPNLPTGQIEVQVDELRILSRSTPLPFQLDEENVDETLRLRYRWLDLRRERLQRNIRLRGQMVGIMRRLMEAAGFVDIQTPILWKPTPEGARDFLVPARLQPGHFYALPQSPQIAKQLLVIAGFERYYQVAVCFRDEDLRADRRAGDHAARRRDGVPRLRAPPRADGAARADDLARVPRRGAGDAVPAADVRRGRSPLRHRQARPSLRARDRGRDGGDARLGVRRLRLGRDRPLPPRAARFLAQPNLPSSRSSRRSGARKGSRTSSTTSRASFARRSRSSCRRRPWRRSTASLARRSSSPPTRGP